MSWRPFTLCKPISHTLFKESSRADKMGNNEPTEVTWTIPRSTPWLSSEGDFERRGNRLWKESIYRLSDLDNVTWEASVCATKYLPREWWATTIHHNNNPQAFEKTHTVFSHARYHNITISQYNNQFKQLWRYLFMYILLKCLYFIY